MANDPDASGGRFPDECCWPGGACQTSVRNLYRHLVKGMPVLQGPQEIVMSLLPFFPWNRGPRFRHFSHCPIPLSICAPAIAQSVITRRGFLTAKSCHLHWGSVWPPPTSSDKKLRMVNQPHCLYFSPAASPHHLL